MKTLRSAAILLVVFALLAAACGKKQESGTTTDQGGTSSGGSTEALAQAASSLEGQTFEMTFNMGFEGMPEMDGVDMSAMSIGGTILGDPANEAVSMTMDMAGLMGGSEMPGMSEGDATMEMIMIGEDAWMAMPMLTGLLGGDAKWIHMSAADLGTSGMSGSPMSGDPTALLAGLGGAAEVTEAGTETVAGVETTRYDFTVNYLDLLTSEGVTDEQCADLGPALASMGFDMDVDIPMSVWIDGDGIPRRVTMEFPFGEMLAGLGVGDAGAGDAKMIITMEVVSIGEAVDIQAPPADEVQEASEIPGFSEGLESAETSSDISTCEDLMTSLEDLQGAGGGLGGSEMPTDMPTDMPELPTDMPEMPAA